jgi:hypothetical protein
LEKAEGLNKAVARCKLRDAETALAAKISEIDTLGTSIPSPDEIPCARAIEHIALLRTTRESQVKAVERAKSRLDEVNGKALSGSWRPKGALPPLGVLHAQKEVATINEEIAETDRTIASYMRDVAAAEEQRLADAEMDAWIRGEGPRPRVLVERDRLEHEEFMRNAFAAAEDISIDFAVMEHATNVSVVLSDFDWSDLGTWGSLIDHMQKDSNGNAVVGNNVHLFETNNCLIHLPKDKVVLLDGIQDTIIVESEGMLMVLRKDKEQELKTYLQLIQHTNPELFV